jgi:sugar O-acyltransferase (sialic acid O-acetyltransferase NeuD family)
MRKIAIFGAGGFGREVAQLVCDINNVKQQYDLIGFYDDGLPIGTRINSWDVLGGVDDLNQQEEPLYMVVAIGDTKIKKNVVRLIINSQIKWATLVHPNAILGDSAFLNIGEGVIITAGCIVTVNINIGDHVILNLSCTVGHDTNIGDYCSFMPTVNISGEVKIEQAVFVGTGAKIINLVEVGENSIIGAGAVVSKDIPPNCTAVGVPAKPIKFHNE